MSVKEITSCEDALRFLAVHLDGELDDPTGRGVERHLETCRSCYSRAEFERKLKRSLAALREEPVPPELTTRVQSLIRTFTIAAPE